MKITKLCILAILIIAGITAKAAGASAYCGYLMGSSDAEKAFLTIETDGSGNIVMSIAPYNGDNNTAFRNDGYSDDRVKAFTVKGDPNTNNKYFTRSINTAKTQITFTPVAGMMHDGDVIIFNQIIEYKTSKDTNLWPTFTFTYTYGTSCAGAPSVTLSPMSINFTPTQGVRTFTLTGANLTSNLTLTPSKGLSVIPTSITPESDGTIATANQTVTVTWESGSTSGGKINISGGGLVVTKNVDVTSSGFSEFCNTLISQDDAGISNMAYATVGTSVDKTQIILSIEPYDPAAGAKANWNWFGSIKVNNVTKTPTITYNTDKTVATLTFPTALLNGDVVSFGSPIVWTLSGTLWNNDNCFMNNSKNYTVGLGCSVAQADITLPSVVGASMASTTSYNAVISVNATDNIGVTNIHFVDAANGINITQLAKTDNGTANYTIPNLQGNTAYSFVVTARDLAGNETAIGNAKTVAFTTLNTPQITASPSSLDFTPTTGSKTFTLSGAYVTDVIQLSVPTGYIITPNSFTPIAGTIAATTVTVNWINGLGNKIGVSGGGLQNPVKLIDLTYSGGFSDYCNYVITQGGGATLTTPALVNISLSDDKKTLTYKIASFDITGDATWNDNSLGASVILLNGASANPTRTKVDSHTITLTFSQALINGDVISYSAGATLVWTTTGYTNYDNNGNCFIDAWSKTYTVGQSCNISTYDLLTNTNASNLSCLNCDINVNSGVLLNIDQSKVVKNISVAPGGKLTTSSNQTLAATTLNLNSDATGTATYIDNGTTTVATANVQQYLPTGRNWYISSPITTKTVPIGSTYFGYQESGDNSDSSVTGATAYWKPYIAGTSLTAGKGYIAQPSSETTLAFSGTLNTGSTTIQLSRTTSATKPGFNLVGNPYPSYLDWSKVTTANTNVLPTAWFRTKKVDGTYTFATVNVADATPVIVANNANTTITKYIPPMQAYWVRLNENPSTTNYTVTNAMRDHFDNAGNKFKAPKQNNLQLVRLQVSNGTNSDETVLYFNAEASNDFDRYDSPKMTNANAEIPEIYTLAGKEQLVINGLNSIALTEEMPLGFTTDQAGSFTIKASEINNFDVDAQIILKDKLLNTQQELTPNSAYNFTSDVSSNANRFSLIFKAGVNVSGVNEPENNLNVSVYKNANNQITVNCSTYGSTATVYNAVGIKLATKQLSGTITVIDNKLSSGVYLVTVSTSGRIVTKKVILN